MKVTVKYWRKKEIIILKSFGNNYIKIYVGSHIGSKETKYIFEKETKNSSVFIDDEKYRKFSLLG